MAWIRGKNVLVDSHCHIDLILEQHPHETADAILARAKKNDVNFILNVCVAMSTFPRVLKLAQSYEHVAVSVGLHPNEQEEEVELDTLLTLGQQPEVIAIGETGLDYYRSTGDLDWQRERFRRHIAAAKQLGKPLIIHTRMAKDDTIAIMQSEKAGEIGGVMHCFSEDKETAKKALDMGFYISFSGIVTFKNATALQEVAQMVPIDRLLIETDAPYLAPVPFRGKPNEPGYVKYTAEFLAQLRQETFSQLATQTTDNFFALFKGAKRPHV